MKKLLIFISVLCILFIGSVYVFIPGKIIITESKIVAVTAGGFDSCLHNLKKWEKWWPVRLSSPPGDSVFSYNGYDYKLSNVFTDGGAVEVRSDKLVCSSRIQVITNNRDSITAEWNAVIPTGNNPLTRLIRYINAPSCKKNIDVVFEGLCNFADKTENIYGFPIQRTTFTEVNLIAYRFKSGSYPAIDIIYNAVNKLRQYLISQGAVEKYYPMMNSKRIDSSQYETMVAISIDKPITQSKTFFLSKMVPMQDRFLVTEVTGGQASIEKAHAAIEKYMNDHSLSAPARPFEILITDRSKETDTAKWKTKIFYPSM